ncbi:hypothetical protein [Halomonas dongshanensis]|uniref:Rad50/SbcC-type AAA domain-containing protein n=1 Tax=Halomonas dongshanensis TaxID=2890835 RepID=A0ABT2ECC9_9GAMM|nr:hypothetical protein [Halomonas dongshanensis]MCS2609174.1 hypothetical protein [Halomonas dongshanensis]
MDTLFVNRFIVKKSKKNVYDQVFGKSVNIIRGTNSIGKSTVMDLLFSCLGGDVPEDRWNKEAKSCDQMIAEIEINGHIITIERAIDPGSKPPIYFFSGTLLDSLKASRDDWQRYGLNRTDNKLSFSQQFFDLLNWPHSQTDDYANLTMHQVLRLIYVDQGTAVNKILRAEHSTFDKPSMRQAIGDFLLGLDDLGVYSLKQQLAKAESEFSKIGGQLDSVYKFISPTEGVLREEHLKEEITEYYSNLVQLTEERQNLLLKPDDDLNENIKDEVEKLSNDIIETSNEIDSLTSERTEVYNEIIESKMFLGSIETRTKALKESRTAYNFFGEVRFKFCPSCLSSLESQDDTCCALCKTPLGDNARDKLYLSTLNELEFQKRESLTVVGRLKSRLEDLNHAIRVLISKLEARKAEHKAALNISSEKILKLNVLSGNIGALQERIVNSESKMKLVSSVEALINEKAELNDKILKLRESIKESKENSDSRREKIEHNLSEKTKELLEKDGGFEPDFNKAKVVQYDFAKDLILVDGRSKFSASSETVLKNSFHLAILMESLEDKDMRYPRFLMLDNTEDKGMGPDRSQNFQRVLIDALSQYKEPYQVIMTTSMIDPDLDKSKYCVGPHYVKGMHTLEI